MKKNDNEGLQRVDYVALSILSIGIIGVFVIPFLVTQKSWGWNFGELQPNAIGDTIGGITAPFVGLISASLVYLALREQVKANRLLANQIDESKTEKVELSIINGLIFEIESVLKSLMELKATENDNKHVYDGLDAAKTIFNSIFYGHPTIIEPPLDYLQSVSKVGQIILRFNQSRITQRHLIKEFEVALLKVLPYTLIQSFEALESDYYKVDSMKGIRLKYGFLRIELNIFHERLRELNLH